MRSRSDSEVKCQTCVHWDRAPKDKRPANDDGRGKCTVNPPVAGAGIRVPFPETYGHERCSRHEDMG
jgi:hypothetical protein